MSETIKALSLWQPWATLIAVGLKKHETRSWSTPYRGPLAIHAAKRPPDMSYEDLGLSDEMIALLPRELPLGVVLCVVQLVDCIPTHQLVRRPHFTTSTDYLLGDYSTGRYAWALSLIHVLREPAAARGSQGLWDWTVPEGVRR